MSCLKRLYITKIASFILYAVIFAEVSLYFNYKLYADSCTCPAGWYTCAGASGKTKCCWGRGCPSAVCGECPCPNGWTFVPCDAESRCWCLKATGGAVDMVCPGACEGCGNHSSEPIQRDIPGYVWTDLNNNNWVDRADQFWFRTGSNMWYFGEYNCAYGPYWSPSHAIGRGAESPSLVVYPGGGNFFCQDPSTTPAPILGVGYYAPMYMLYGLWTSQSYYAYITPPAGIDCNNVKYMDVSCANRKCDKAGPPTIEHTGTGCGFVFDPHKYRNEIDWQIVYPAVSATTVNGRIYETTNTGSCSNNGNIALPGLTATTYNGVTTGKSGAVNSGTGNYSISTLSTDLFDAVCINGSLSTAATAYVPACVTASATGGGFTCTKGSGACAVSCSPTNKLATSSSITINFGLTKIDNDKWFSVIDGDFYAANVLTYVAQSPLGGFSPNIINTSVGGFGFSGATIDTQTTGTKVSQKGGAGTKLTAGTTSFEDKWFNKFGFTAPIGAVTSVPGGNAFVAGRVYNLTTAQFNTVLASGSYTITAPDESKPDTAIVYITDGGTMTINNTITTDKPDLQTLLVITNGNVNIAETVSNQLATFSITDTAQIALNIVSKGNITTKSKYSETSSTVDDPIMLSGTVISRGKVDFQRDLGALGNSQYPAEVVRFFPYISALIKKYELANTAIFGYTGLGVFDVQFDYSK